MDVKIETLPGPSLLLIVIDGIADRPIPQLGFKTPLQLARKENIDKLAKQGLVGFHYPISPGIAPGSGVAHLHLFNYSIKECPERGVLEALGAGIKLKEGDVAARINFATCDEDDIVLDRRAERNEAYLKELAEEIEKALEKNEFGVEIEIVHTTQHRGVLVVRDWGYGYKVKDTDPVEEGRKIILPKGEREIERLVRFIHEKAKKVAKESEWNKKRKEKGIKEANCILMRGFGKFFKVEPFEKRNGLKNPVAIADHSLYLGAGKFVGMETYNLKDEEKIEKALKLVKKHEFVFVHFKKTDNASHDGNWKKKIEEIEKIDKILSPLFEFREEIALALTGDHATPCILKEHTGDPVPILFWGKNIPSEGLVFNEREAKKGWIGYLRGRDVIPMLINLAGRMKEVGK